MNPPERKAKYVETRDFEKYTIKGTILEVLESQLNRLSPASKVLSIHYSVIWSALSIAITTLSLLFTAGMNQMAQYFSWVLFALSVLIFVIFCLIIWCSSNPVEEIVKEIRVQNQQKQ
jgi:ABC-type bacteriocin/lantibiotic exporter with double-glycine peptidase domain